MSRGAEGMAVEEILEAEVLRAAEAIGTAAGPYLNLPISRDQEVQIMNIVRRRLLPAVAALVAERGSR